MRSSADAPKIEFRDILLPSTSFLKRKKFHTLQLERDLEDPSGPNSERNSTGNALTFLSGHYASCTGDLEAVSPQLSLGAEKFRVAAHIRAAHHQPRTDRRTRSCSDLDGMEQFHANMKNSYSRLRGRTSSKKHRLLLAVPDEPWENVAHFERSAHGQDRTRSIQ